MISMWGRMTMQRKWREWLTKHMFDYWLGNGNSRRLRFMSGEIQTPEYRIAEDVRVATEAPIDLVLGLLSSFLTAATFIGVLWIIGDVLLVNAFGLTLAISQYLVIAVVAYSILLTTATIVIGRRFTHVIEGKNRAEAELRSIGSHLRETSEGTALPDGKTDGRRRAVSSLDRVIARWLEVCWQFVRLTLISQTTLLLTPGHCFASLHAEISRRINEPRRSRPSGCSVRNGTRSIQLDPRQLWPSCGLDLFCKSSGITTTGIGSDRGAK